MAKRRSNTAAPELSSSSRERRALIVGAGTLAAAGTIAGALGAVLPSKAQAAETRAMRCLTVLYKNGDNVKFDFDYYKDHHLTMIMQLYGKSIHKFELRQGVKLVDGSKAPYVAVVNIWVADDGAFDANNAKYTPKLVADVPNFTNTTAVIQEDRVYADATS